MITNNKIQQLKRGTLEMIILFLINNKNCSYGYAIINEFNELGDYFFKNAKPGTIYPILYRLEDDGLIYTIKDDKVSQKKQYKLTKLGKTELNNMIVTWRNYVSTVEQILQEWY